MCKSTCLFAGSGCLGCQYKQSQKLPSVWGGERPTLRVVSFKRFKCFNRVSLCCCLCWFQGDSVFLESDVTFPNLPALIEHYYLKPLPQHGSLRLQKPYGTNQNSWGPLELLADPGHAQNSLQGPFILSGLGTPRGPPAVSGGSLLGEGGLGFSPAPVASSIQRLLG